MIRSELIDALSSKYPELHAGGVAESVALILKTMAERLGQGGRIEIRGFGVFHVNHVPAKTGRNPRSGQTVHIPAKRVPRFRAGKELRERVLK